MDRDLVLDAIEDVRTLRAHLSALANYHGVYQRALEVAALGAEVLASVEDRLVEALNDGPYVSWPSNQDGRTSR